MTESPAIRRVVTGYDESGAPAVLFDGPATSVTELPAIPGTALVDLWRSDSLPLDLTGRTETTSGDFQIMPEGAVFRIIDLAPVGDGEPMWHQTSSVDFIYIASGEVTFLYEGGQVDLATGETIVQRGIRHAWSNPGPEVCRIINVSVAAA